MIKAKPWSGKDLKGDWQVTYKIDGVRALYIYGSGWVSRAMKPLYNMPFGPTLPGYSQYDKTAKPGDVLWDCEVYCGTPGMSSAQRFKRTIQMVRSKSDKYGPILPSELYSLEPLDQRLEYRTGRPFGIIAPGKGAPITNPTAENIRIILTLALVRGVEGLVLRQGDKWLKVKPVDTYDVYVTKAIEGLGKHRGRMGALVTAYGKVGTGFTDPQRVEWWDWWKRIQVAIQGKTAPRLIEVSCMSITGDGKFRHPRFIRLRPDKNEESPPERPEE